MPMTVYIPSQWGNRAKDLLLQAADEVDSGIDAIGTVDLALTCLRIEAGEIPESDLEDYDFEDAE